MNVSMDFDMEGFTQACEATLSRVSRGTRVAAQEAGSTILKIAQLKCPRFTGTLMNSGQLTIEGSSKNNYSPGFSATVSFGGGTDVNPLTGQHPSEYAAAVHEGFAVNPITGEMSEYKSGEPRFLAKAVGIFERSGLHKAAYKHWKQAIYPNNDDFYNPIGTRDTTALMVDRALMNRMGAGDFGVVDSQIVGRPSYNSIINDGAKAWNTYDYRTFKDTGEIMPDKKVLYAARRLSEKRVGPSTAALGEKRPDSLYRYGRRDTISELATYISDVAWFGAEFASERASDSILALVGKYHKAGYKLTGSDPGYDRYKRARSK